MTAKEARQLCEQAGAPLPAGMEAGNFEKVSNTRRKILDGIEFRSTLEADTYRLLKAWEAVGVISGLVCQPKYLLQPKMRLNGKAVRAITYVADFQFDKGRRRHVIDAKGFRMPVYRIKVKLFRARFPQVVFEEWTRETLKSHGG